MRYRFPQKNRKRLVFLGVAFVLLCALLVWGVYALLRIEATTVQSVEIEGNKIVQIGVVEEVVREKLQGTYLWMIPKSHVFFYPRNSIKTALAETFPRILTVDVKIRHFDTIVVSVTEREPYALWCAHSESCFFMDETGFVFSKAPIFSDHVFRVYEGIIREEDNIGTYYMDPQYFKSLSSFLDALPQYGLVPYRIVAEPDSKLFTIQTENSVELLIEEEENYTHTLRNLDAIMQDDNIAQSKLNDFEDVEYINLRFNTKVFYKLREVAVE